MKQLLLDIVNSIVDHPEKVKLDESTDSEGTLNFTLTVDPEDMGKIIGKEGKVIKSIRTIIRIPAIKQDKKVNLELTEQDRVDKEDSETNSGSDTGTNSNSSSDSIVEPEEVKADKPKDEEAPEELGDSKSEPKEDKDQKDQKDQNDQN